VNWKERSSVGLLDVKLLFASTPKRYLVRRYADRIAVQSKDETAISWEVLQNIKREVLGDVVAIEVFPMDADVVNLQNTRHLWFGDAVNEVVKACTHPEFTEAKK
jgi:hypothetical protein